jgi:hypothetical protein
VDPLKNGLILREVPFERGPNGVLPVVLASGCVICGAPRGETVYVLTATSNGFYAEPGWSNSCGHPDDHNSAVAESITYVAMLLDFPNEQIQAVAQFYVDTASKAYISTPPVGRTSFRAGAA